MALNYQDRKFLFDLLSLPTAPYREDAVQKLCIEYLVSNSIPFFKDAIGNLVVGARDLAQYKLKLNRATSEPVKMVIAHTDHPGFHGEKWISNNKLKIRWFGGSPTQHLKDSKVWVALRGHSIKHSAKLLSTTLQKHKHSIKEGIVTVETPWWNSVRERPQANELFGAFRFRKPVWEKNHVIYTGGADDVVGVFTILQTAKALWKKASKDQNNFVALLSRAEEVGFIGTIGHFEKVLPKKMKRELLVLSLETSRTLPGALVGRGPVVRLGDRSSVFDSQYTTALHLCAKKHLKQNFQRRIMDGGSCEATAAISYGVKAVGISVPLGNYHNISYEGGPDSRGHMGPAPEFVHLHDVEGQRTLCLEFVKMSLSNRAEFFKEQRKNYRRWLHEADDLLK